MEPVKTNETTTPVNPLFPFMGIGSLLYALLYTICLYHNPSGISYPFYIGGTCLFFCFFLLFDAFLCAPLLPCTVLLINVFS